MDARGHTWLPVAVKFPTCGPSWVWSATRSATAWASQAKYRRLYAIGVFFVLRIFIEAQLFEKLRERYMDDDQYRLLQAALMERPESGDPIRGSGAARKERWSERGKGKRGGLRVIYRWITRCKDHLFLTVHRKS
jgi:mRNA-degrading endonuclease RelE of RelBE toxin-antitoxin system